MHDQKYPECDTWQQCSILGTTQLCIHTNVSTSMLASFGALRYTVYWKSGVLYLGQGWLMSELFTLILHIKASFVNRVQGSVVKNL